MIFQKFVYKFLKFNDEKTNAPAKKSRAEAFFINFDEVRRSKVGIRLLVNAGNCRHGSKIYGRATVLRGKWGKLCKNCINFAA